LIEKEGEGADIKISRLNSIERSNGGTKLTRIKRAKRTRRSRRGLGRRAQIKVKSRTRRVRRSRPYTRNEIESIGHEMEDRRSCEWTLKEIKTTRSNSSHGSEGSEGSDGSDRTSISHRVEPEDEQGTRKLSEKHWK